MNSSSLIFSVKKELWEFNKILIWVPIALALLLLAIPSVQLFFLEDYQVKRLFSGLDGLAHLTDNGEIAQAFFAITSGLFIPFITTASLVQVYYLLTCLYDERRDLSVYFWRSLPVSDGQTIAIKLLTGALIIPAIFLLVATLCLLLLLIIAVVLCAVLATGYDINLWHLWGQANIVSSLTLLWLTLLPYTLWLLPVYCWLLLASMYAKKSPFLVASLPIVILLLVEAFVVHNFGLSHGWLSEWLMHYFNLSEHSVNTNGSLLSAIVWVPFNVFVDKVALMPLLFAGVFVYLTCWLRANRSQPQ